MAEKKSFDKNMRLKAWNILLQEGFVSLPIKPQHFLEKYHLHLISYSKYGQANTISHQELMEEYNEDGFIVLCNESYYIIYNEKKPSLRIKWTIMQQICHYLLGHITPETPIYLRNSGTAEQLSAACDKLVSRIFCPSIVLHLCAVSSAEELGKLCDISTAAAKIQFQHLTEIRRNDRFLTFPEEQAVLMQFAPFISSYLCKKFSQPSAPIW